MYCIIGTEIEVSQTEIGGPFEEFSTEFIVATFDEKTDAENYVEKSKLKKPLRQSFSAINL